MQLRYPDIIIPLLLHHEEGPYLLVLCASTMLTTIRYTVTLLANLGG